MKKQQNNFMQDDNDESPNHQWMLSFADRILNPVSSISAAIGLLEKDLSLQGQHTGSSENIIDKVKQSLNSIELFIRELVDLTQPIILHKIEFNIEDALRQAQQRLQKMFPYEYEVVLDLSEHQTLYADFEKTVTIFVALIANAIEATPRERKPHVKITFKFEPPLSTLEVTDNGDGISSCSAEELFTPFFSTKMARTGVGLSLVAKYMSAHKGELDIGPANEGTGTTIVLKFPNTRDS